MANENVPALPPITSSPETTQQGGSQIQIPSGPDFVVGPTTKDIMIGGGVLLVLTIVFFFVRISFVNYLTGSSMKRSPNIAGMAGWGLFGGLFFGGTLGCAALVSKTYMTMPLIIALSVLSLICFAIALVVASKK
ncbi:MAG: hypothetical protein WBN77_11610 [Desulfobacterales bacterium]